MGIFDRLREGLRRTRAGFVDRVRRVLRGRTRIDDELYDELEAALIQADVGVQTTRRLLEALRDAVARGRVADPGAVLGLLKDECRALLGEGVQPLRRAATPPTVIVAVGVNGAGKTTTIGKLAAQLRGEGQRVVLAASDTFRAAAIDQLEVWAKRAGAELIRHAEGADPAAVAFDALAAARSRRADTVIVDTAGRLHTKVNLMEELKKVRRVIQRECAGAPHEVLLVLDATTGQNAIQQARVFREAIEVTGIALTKLDSSSKGGVVLAIAAELGVPVKLIGVGEKIDDLRPFDPAEFVEALFEDLG